MKLRMNYDQAVSLLKKKILDLNQPTFNAEAWKNSTINDLNSIFGPGNLYWLQITKIHFDTFIAGERAKTLATRKETARQTLQSIIDTLEREKVTKMEEEVSFKAQYTELLKDWNELVGLYNSLVVDYENLQDVVADLQEQIEENKTTEELFPFEIIANTRNYFERPAKQAMSCYSNGQYDACLVMIRKLIESLIIEIYEHHKIESEIKDPKTGNYFFLSVLLDKFMTNSNWNVSRNSKAAALPIKSKADMSAHNRMFNAKKKDIDDIKDSLRILIEELVHLSHTQRVVPDQK